ncbi:hypothetical protein [Pyxidicoccus caerfyrddinensis]|uniref:hypothetical protein n=1 Tax=Pyxidicoccus caerfyrddinensis TaxID=2709663 RepID=UPI0013D9B31D|nr:hypothetical protein [Pyxidicoccus caerfyrddinensis]
MSVGAYIPVMGGMGSAVASSLSTLDAGELRSRGVVGVSAASDRGAVRECAERQGVPPGALVVEVVEPIVVRPGGG